MAVLQVYSRQGCHLCEVLIEELLPLVRGVLEIEVRDIDSRPDWLAKYHVHVPVVEHEDRLISRYPLDHDAIYGLLEHLSQQSGD